jgi:hypothetical protein
MTTALIRINIVGAVNSTTAIAWAILAVGELLLAPLIK